MRKIPQVTKIIKIDFGYNIFSAKINRLCTIVRFIGYEGSGDGITTFSLWTTINKKEVSTDSGTTFSLWIIITTEH